MKLIFGFRFDTLWDTWHNPPWGGGGGGGGADQPHTPETEIPNMALEWFRPMQFYFMI